MLKQANFTDLISLVLCQANALWGLSIPPYQPHHKLLQWVFTHPVHQTQSRCSPDSLLSHVLMQQGFALSSCTNLLHYNPLWIIQIRKQITIQRHLCIEPESSTSSHIFTECVKQHRIICHRVWFQSLFFSCRSTRRAFVPHMFKTYYFSDSNLCPLCRMCLTRTNSYLYSNYNQRGTAESLPSPVSNLAVYVVTKYNISAAIRQAALYSYEFSAASKNPKEKELHMWSTALEAMILFFVALLG